MNKEDTSKLDTAHDELNDLKIHYDMLATLAAAIPAFESTPKMITEEKEIAETETLDLDGALLVYKNLSFRQRKAFHQFTHAGINLMTQKEEIMSQLLESSSDFLQDIILDLRNEHVAQEILTNTDKNIYLIYGALHYQGIFELLQESDSNWQVIDTSYTQLIQ